MEIQEASQYWAAFFIGVATVGGIGGLLFWAITRGQFKDIERPGRRMLEIDEETGVRK
ncbi:MAG: cbb3-type cytochrome oxidase assembly protein [Verrucomicrobiota bacterium]